MAQSKPSPGTPKQPQDPYAQRGKPLASSVRRLRGWIGSDPSRLPELVDALNALVAHRLVGHAWAAAAADAQDAVRRSAELMLADGPVGPYSTPVAATRCGTALVQLARLQAGLGLADAAGRTLESWDGLRDQLAAAAVEARLEPRTVVWALSSAARARLAAGEVGPANAHADAALAAAAAAGLAEAEPAGYVGFDTERLVADGRWVAGRVEESLRHLHVAQRTHEALSADRLAEPGRYPTGLVERLAEPVFGLYRDLADRLAATGERDLALVHRRRLCALLGALAARGLEPAPGQLAAARTDLAAELLAADRVDEALAEADQAAAAARDPDVPAPVVLLARAVLEEALARSEGADHDPSALVRQAAGQAPAQPGASDLDRARGVLPRGPEPVSWAPLDPAAGYGVVEPTAPAALPEPEPTQAWLEAERAEAHRRELERQEQARREAEQRRTEAERAAAAAAAVEAARREAEEEERRREAERRAAAEAAEQQERKRRRQERLLEHEREEERRAAQARAVRRDEITARMEALSQRLPTAAEEEELGWLRSELAELDRTEGRVAAEEQVPVGEPVPGPGPGRERRPEPEPEDVVPAGPRPAEPPAPEPEPVPGRAPEPEPVPAPEPDPLDLAEAAWAAARGDGSRREVRAAAERVVELLRPRAEADPAYTARLRPALENLASARLRVGDIFGSRAATKEARALDQDR